MLKAHALSGQGSVLHLFVPGLVGMVFSFVAGLLALKWLSRWLEGGRWKFFGFYCLVAAAGVLLIHFKFHELEPQIKNHFAFGSGMKIFFPTIKFFGSNPGFAARIWLRRHFDCPARDTPWRWPKACRPPQSVFVTFLAGRRLNRPLPHWS